MKKSRLSLRREKLGELSPEDLTGVAGAQEAVTTVPACAILSVAVRCDDTCCSCTAVSDTIQR